eukprot:scaffold215757_cov56-Attheya_sp.AAC.1
MLPASSRLAHDGDLTTPMTRHPSVGGHTEQAQHITLYIFYTHPTIIKEARGLAQCSSLFDEPGHAN